MEWVIIGDAIVILFILKELHIWFWNEVLIREKIK